MEPVTKYLDPRLTQRSQQSKNSRPLDTELDSRKKQIVNHLFLKMSSIFGTKWASNYPSKELEQQAKREWYDALESVPSDRIKFALELARDRSDWPPSIAQFLSYTLEAVPKACHQPFPKALPKPPPNKEIASKAMSEIRAMLSRT